MLEHSILTPDTQISLQYISRVTGTEVQLRGGILGIWLRGVYFLYLDPGCDFSPHNPDPESTLRIKIHNTVEKYDFFVLYCIFYN